MQEEIILKQEMEEQKSPTMKTAQNQRLQLRNLLHELVAKNPDHYTQLIFELREALQTHFNQVSESKQKEQIKLVIGMIQQPLELAIFHREFIGSIFTNKALRSKQLFDSAF